MNMRKLKKNVMAVSPVIATLMLVLVSVGSAGAFYVWQSGWQRDVNEKAGTAELQSQLSIGGSSTVYEFLLIAKEIFEAQNPNFKVDIQKGGSGAGLMGAGLGLVDIGSASSDKSSSFYKYPDFNRDGVKDLGIEMINTKIGYDGVVVVVSEDRTDLISIGRDTLAQIYQGDITLWNEVPMNASAVGNSTDGYHNCTDLDTKENKIETYGRSVHSGTEECFFDKLMAGEVDDASDQMDVGETHALPSNQDIVSSLADNPDGIGFMATGLVKDDSGLRAIPFSENGGPFVNGTLADYGGDELGLPSTDSIMDETWPGSRALWFITAGEPTGAAKVFIDFCLRTEANQNICHLSDYISLYD
jgi:phosphate transport system substrate-binding protein